jgi:hypothetical protein
MDKIFLQKLANVSDLVGNIKKFNNYFHVDVEAKNFQIKELHIFEKRLEEISNNVNNATKFFITKDVCDFVADNINEIAKQEKMQADFNIPTDKPLLIQLQESNITLIISKIYGVPYADYQVDLFANYDETKKILINPFCSFAFNKKFFKSYFEKYPTVYLDLHLQTYVDLDTNDASKEWRENRSYVIYGALCMYFSFVNLSKDLQVLEEEKVTGIEKQINKNFSLSSFIQKPNFEHKTLDIRLGNKNQQNISCNKKHNKKKMHGVRGHLRQLQNGKIVWVSPYKRGDSSLGVITKDYTLKVGKGK